MYTIFSHTHTHTHRKWDTAHDLVLFRRLFSSASFSTRSFLSVLSAPLRPPRGRDWLRLLRFDFWTWAREAWESNREGDKRSGGFGHIKVAVQWFSNVSFSPFFLFFLDWEGFSSSCFWGSLPDMTDNARFCTIKTCDDVNNAQGLGIVFAHLLIHVTAKNGGVSIMRTLFELSIKMRYCPRIK